MRLGVALLLFIGVVAAQVKPTIRVSPGRVKSGDPVVLIGSGFTPQRSALSHLLRPDGTEHNPLRFYTNPQGEFSHRIETSLLEVGKYELWVEDEVSKVVSNRIEFTVE
jgi:hypothetical protein